MPEKKREWKTEKAALIKYTLEKINLFTRDSFSNST